MASVINSNTQAITMSEVANVTFRSLIGCLYVLLLNVSFIMMIHFYNCPSLPITIPATCMWKKGNRQWAVGSNEKRSLPIAYCPLPLPLIT
jgi:hypothetical protein